MSEQKMKNQKPGCLISILGFFGTILISLLLTVGILATTIYACYKHTIDTLPDTMNKVINAAIVQVDNENDQKVSKGLESIGYELSDIYPEEFITSISTSVTDNIFYGKKTPVDFASFTENYRELMVDLSEKGIDMYVDSLQNTDLNEKYEDINELFKSSYGLDLSQYVDKKYIDMAGDKLSNADLDKIKTEAKAASRETIYTVSDKLMDEEIVDELNKALDELYEDEDMKNVHTAIEEVESKGIAAICAVFFIVFLLCLIHFFMYSQKHRAVRNFSLCFFFATLIHLVVCIAFSLAISELGKAGQEHDTDKEIAEMATDIISDFSAPFKAAAAFCFIATIVLFVLSRIMKRKERTSIEEEDILELKG